MSILKYFIAVAPIAGLCACGSSGDDADNGNRAVLVSRIDSLEKLMVDPKTLQLNPDLVRAGTESYQEFIYAYPKDTLSAHYLFRLSDLLAHGTGDFARSMECLKMIEKKYPDFRRYPDCLFLQGYYYQEFFHDTVSAKAYYQSFLDKYPDHAFADDARAMLSMFGKTEEQILKEFEDRAAQENKSQAP